MNSIFLDAKRQETFDRDGFVVLDELISEDEVTRLDSGPSFEQPPASSAQSARMGVAIESKRNSRRARRPRGDPSVPRHASGQEPPRLLRVAHVMPAQRRKPNEIFCM
jgi:hypothetical protein